MARRRTRTSQRPSPGESIDGLVTAYVIPPGQEKSFVALASPPASTGCELSGASIDRDHVDALYACGATKIVAKFVHPDAASPTSTVAGPFAISFDREPPPALKTWLESSLAAPDGPAAKWAWLAPQPTPSPSTSISSSASPATHGIPVDPRSGPIGMERRTDVTARVLPLVESAASVACVGALLVALIRLRLSKLDRALALGVFAVALLLRLVVPRVPANFYTDLNTGVANFSYNVEYRAPLHLLLSVLHLPASSLLLANVLLGSASAALLYVGLRTLDVAKTEPGERAKSILAPERVALAFSLLVATAPTFLRLSASDAAHIVGLAWLSAAVVLLGRSLQSTSAAWLGALACTCWLIGAARRELALAPLGLVGLAMLSDAPKSKKGAASAAALLGTGLGAMLTPIVVLGVANVEIAASKDWALTYLRLLPTAATASFDGLPHVIRPGLVMFALGAILTRRPGLLVAYLIVFVSQTWIYAVSIFSSVMDHPLESWALARYALLWLLVPLYFAAAGLTYAWSSLASRPRWMGYLAAAVVGGIALLSLPSAFRLHGYQHEYLFLRSALPQAPGDVPLVVVWQKNGGVDYCEALAAPHYGYSELPRRRPILALPTGIPLSMYFDELPAQFLYFHNVLSQIDLRRLDAYPGYTKASLEEARRTDCVLRTGQLLDARRGLPVMYIQFFLEDAQRADLELWMVDREAARARLPDCDRVEAHSGW